MKQLFSLKAIRELFSAAKDRTNSFLDNHRSSTTSIHHRQLTAIPFNSRLCKCCQVWNDPTSIFQRPVVATFIPLQIMLLYKDCIICQVLSDVALDKLHIRDREISDIRVIICGEFLVKHGDFHDEHGMERYISERIRHGNSIDCIVRVHIQDIRADPKPTIERAMNSLLSRCLLFPGIGVQLSLSYQSNPTQLSQVKTWDAPFFDTQLLKSLLAKCKHHHRNCKNLEAELPPGFRLIDTEKLCVTEPSHSPSFVALSYMWNSSLGGKDLQLCQGTLQRLQMPGGIDVSELPDVVADAVRLCEDLGERYLWVDRLCIVQDDSSAKHTQINAMGSVYGMASLTIVAATNPAQVIGLPGTRGRPRKPFEYNDTRNFNEPWKMVDGNFHHIINNSAWNARAWTFQERVLSLRCLYITDFQVYLSCPGVLFQEDVGAVRKRDYDQSDQTSSFNLPYVIKIKGLQGYSKYVSQYTTRNLSYQSDILNAFSGVTGTLSKLFGTRFFFGLPERYFTQALLWSNHGYEARRSDVPEVPSWSWAAWSGPVHFSHLCFMPSKYAPPMTELNTGVLVKFYIQDSEIGLQALAVQESWFGRSYSSPDEQHAELEQYHFNEWDRMPTRSQTKLARNWYLQNILNIHRHTSLDPIACALARKYPGCLVFNTTVASLRLEKYFYNVDDGSYQHFVLSNEERRSIGRITVGRQWAEEAIDTEKKHSFIVLCAELIPEHIGHDLGSDWLLMVMLIQRNGGVARRLGLGYVGAMLWRTAEPKWETRVLT